MQLHRATATSSADRAGMVQNARHSVPPANHSPFDRERKLSAREDDKAASYAVNGDGVNAT